MMVVAAHLAVAPGTSCAPRSSVNGRLLGEERLSPNPPSRRSMLHAGTASALGAIGPRDVERSGSRVEQAEEAG